MFVALEERFRESRLHVGEPGEKTAEHQDFSGQEQPHTNFGGIELLFLGSEVMLQIRVVMPVRARVASGCPSTGVEIELI